MYKSFDILNLYVIIFCLDPYQRSTVCEHIPEPETNATRTSRYDNNNT